MGRTMTELTQFLEKTGIPKEQASRLTGLWERLTDEELTSLKIMAEDFYRRLPGGLSDYMPALADMARRTQATGYLVQFLFYVRCSPLLLRDYRLRGIGEDVFWDTMQDFRAKLEECVRCGRAAGGFADGSDWFTGFFAMTRFALGRLQFELAPFRYGKFERAGQRIFRGEQALNLHIPSCGGRLTREVRLDAYRRAKRFFADSFPAGPVPFVCDSWLLFPAHREFLPEGSNILDFMDDFTIIDSFETEGFEEGWRLFYDKAGLPPDQLPRDTSLRRAYADWLAAGRRTGSGYGVFFFDGERIL